VAAAFTNEPITPKRTAPERRERENILIEKMEKVKDRSRKQKYCKTMPIVGSD
jgi:hypothetical protein